MTYKPTAEERLKGLDAVYYEIKQLVDTLVPKSDYPALGNALVESRLLHVRNLIDFFASESRNNDDILATHFGFELSPVALGEPYKSRLNKDLAHLTYSRTRRSKTEKRWPVEDVITPVLERSREFIRYVLSSHSVYDDIGPMEWRELELHIGQLLAS